VNYPVLLALLAELKVLDKDKAEALADRLTKSTQPARFKEASQLVKDVFAEVDKHK